MAQAALLLPVIAGAGSAVAAGSATLGTLLALTTLGVSAIGMMEAGEQKSSMYKQQAAMFDMQARQAGLNAQLEGIKGRQTALQIKQQRDQNLASINAAYAARGAYTGSGSPLQAMLESRRNAADAINTAMFNSSTAQSSAIMEQGQLQQQAAGQRSEARAARQSGMINAISTIAGSSKLQSLLDYGTGTAES